MKVSISATTLVCVFTIASPAIAQLHPKAQTGPRTAALTRASRLETDSVNAELARNHVRALSRADEANRIASHDGWGEYLRGDAFVSMGRTRDAVSAFRAAEQRFGDSDPWAKSVAIWGQANALEEVGKCLEAAPIYERYAAFVAHLDPAAAALARERAKLRCVPPAPAPYTPQEIASMDFETGGNHQRALEQAELAIKANPQRPWGYLLRGDALLGLRRFQEAVDSYRQAQTKFTPTVIRGESIAIWGEANALKEAGRRCEALPVYERYAAYVEKRDTAGAQMARQYAKTLRAVVEPDRCA
jgi:tetratricopeptide (TPR) repeat protein